MFLKRIEMQGFKSFADRVTINFDHNMTGIVGPNGCGKSNIADAIKWVLGEQSAKTLRGEKMSDVIFAGSLKRRGVNMAEVTLVFDNSKRNLNYDADEVELTRRIYKDDQDAEYLINHQNVRLKDVIDLVLDSGLGKDSLSMISQGNIQSFAEARPYDRRAIFEEAAGVARYKKRKIEAINRLERTKNNLERTYDILSELEKQVGPLKRQAKRAELYKDKKEALEAIETAVLVEEISLLQDQVNAFKDLIVELDTKIETLESGITIRENQNFHAKEEARELERKINDDSTSLIATINEIQVLENRHTELEQKRKYAIEHGNDEEKSAHLKDLYLEAKNEYEDRQKRHDELNEKLENDLHKQAKLSRDLANLTLEKDEAAALVNRLKNRQEILENLIKNPFDQAHGGVKAILDNSFSLYGIKGVIAKLITPQDGYEQSLEAALGGALYNIVTKDEASARNAISFLKKNRMGRATFLPMTVMKARNIRNDQELIAKNTAGCLGLMSDFVNCDDEYLDICLNLLGTVLVCEDLESANHLASLLKYTLKIVTLDGDIVNRGGSMTGGRNKNTSSMLSANRDLAKVKSDLVSFEAQAALKNKEYQELILKRQQLEDDITKERIALASLESVLEVKRSKLIKAENDLKLLNIDTDINDEHFNDDIISFLNQSYSKRDELNNALKINRNHREQLNTEIERKDQQITQLRKDLREDEKRRSDTSNQLAIIETKLKSDLERLGQEYGMTFEYAKENVAKLEIDNAKEEVLRLRQEIQNLGHVNMEAPLEYSKIAERYDFLKKNYDDLLNSRDKILAAIAEMDETMKSEFKKTFEAINAELPKTFKALFGGGKARLVMEDPEDILNTGIDIDVEPPGKTIKSIRLFSGGEKSLIAICVLFTIIKVKGVPLVIFDEVEAALDQANVERFAKYTQSLKDSCQFIIITHRSGTMVECDVLYGVTMQHQGVSQMLKVELVDAIKMSDEKEEEL